MPQYEILKLARKITNILTIARSPVKEYLLATSGEDVF
jgi:hypothetical protein